MIIKIILSDEKFHLTKHFIQCLEITYISVITWKIRTDCRHVDMKNKYVKKENFFCSSVGCKRVFEVMLGLSILILSVILIKDNAGSRLAIIK